MTDHMTRRGPTRGEINKNPGNLIYSPQNAWRGQLGLEVMPPGRRDVARFACFDTPQNGIRALAKLLLHYQSEGLSTVRQIIDRYAPPVENNTRGYAGAVAAYLGIDETALVNLSDPATMEKMVRAIIREENGAIVYDDSVIWQGVARAMSA